jgi:hypothetical protein
MQAREKIKPGTLSKIFASHPQMASRIANTQKQIDTKLPPRPQYVVTRSEFDEVRLRLAVLENRQRVTDDKQETKPSLRRASKTTGNSNTEDDRPTLKRRDNRSD